MLAQKVAAGQENTSVTTLCLRGGADHYFVESYLSNYHLAVFLSDPTARTRAFPLLLCLLDLLSLAGPLSTLFVGFLPLSDCISISTVGSFSFLRLY